jgi:endonuclease III
LSSALQRIALPSRSEFIAEIERRLRKTYGTPDLGNVDDPLDELIYVILSLQTNERNYRRVWVELRRRFPIWQHLLKSRPSTLVRALTPAGLARQKAAHIRAILRTLMTERGTTSLDFLRTMSNVAVERYLTALPGVGIKTARCVELYSLKRDVFPVDVHALRILKRVGIVPETLHRKLAHDPIQEIVPRALRYTLHVNLVVHGRERCLPRAPRCSGCSLNDICRFAAAKRAVPVKPNRDRMKKSMVSITSI